MLQIVLALGGNHELPDEEWTEEKILSLLETSTGDSAAKAGYARTKGLEELSKRTIKNYQRAADVLLTMARKHGTSKPESLMIVQILAALVNMHEELFATLLERLKDKDQQLLYCISITVQNLDRDKKHRAVPSLMKALMNQDAFTYVTREMYKTLVSMGDEEINNEIVRLALPHLASPDPYKVVYAVKILSKLANRDATSNLCDVLGKSFKGWYNGDSSEIQKEICNFFQRVGDKRSLPYLLELLRQNPTIEASKALASVADVNPEVMDQLYEAMRSERDKLTFPILQALKETSRSRIDTNRLFEVIPTTVTDSVIGDLRKF